MKPGPQVGLARETSNPSTQYPRVSSAHYDDVSQGRRGMRWNLCHVPSLRGGDTVETPKDYGLAVAITEVMASRPVRESVTT